MLIISGPGALYGKMDRIHDQNNIDPLQQQRLAAGSSWLCEESEGARRRRSRIRNSAALTDVFQATAAFFQEILFGSNFPTWEEEALGLALGLGS